MVFTSVQFKSKTKIPRLRALFVPTFGGDSVALARDDNCERSDCCGTPEGVP